MIEELYIIRDNTRYKLDLLQPSGISLCFNSNLFNDLSKIDCSKSYTFKLPNTATNAKAFDLVGDMRYTSALYGLKIPCEYWVDGVPIVTDGNLYVSELNAGVYSAVMTFAFIAGLQALSDNDVDITELGNGETISFGGDGTMRGWSYADYSNPENYDNATAQTPMYSAGLPVFRNSNPSYYNISSLVQQRPIPPPVMPLYAIMTRIAEHYGLTFDFLTHYDYADWQQDITDNVAPTFIETAGIPFVTTMLSEEYEEQQSIEFNNLLGVQDVSFEFSDRHGTQVTITIERTLNFGTYSYSAQMDFLAIYGAHYGSAWKAVVNAVSMRIGGSLYVSFNATAELENPPHLLVVTAGLRGQTTLADIEPQYDSVNSTSGNQIYYWDFRETEGFDPYDVDEMPSKNAPICFALTETPDTFISGSLVVYPHFEEGIGGHNVRVYDCLPPVSAMAVVKSLFYILGGFPKIGAGGAIGISYFSELRDNLAAGNVYDWTQNALIDYGADPATLKFTNGNLGIKNYLLMKNESLSAKETSKTDDLYDSPLFNLECENHILEKTKTLYQFPYYGRFVRNGQHHSLPTGNTIKYWSVDDNMAVASEAKPAIGTFSIDANTGLLSFSVWQTDDANEQYTYLQSIIEKPYIVKIPMRFAFADLLGIDYARPVYIAQLNAYFAIIQIVANSNGTATAELIKLP